MNPILRLGITYAPLCATAFVRLSGIGFIHQIATTKQTNNICPIPFIAMMINSILGTYYGYLLNNFNVFIASSTGFVCGSLYFGLYLAYTTLQSRIHYLKILLFSSIVLGVFIATPFVVAIGYPVDYIGLGSCFMAVFTMGSPLASMQKVLKEKNTNSMSLVMSLAMTANGITWTIYGIIIMHGNLFIVVTNLLGAIAGFIQLTLFCIIDRAKWLRTRLVVTNH